MHVPQRPPLVARIAALTLALGTLTALVANASITAGCRGASVEAPAGSAEPVATAVPGATAAPAPTAVPVATAVPAPTAAPAAVASSGGAALTPDDVGGANQVVLMGASKSGAVFSAWPKASSFPVRPQSSSKTHDAGNGK